MDVFPEAPRILPEAILEFDLLRAFIWYISIYFATSLLLRVRMYVAVFRIIRHVQDECPIIYKLIQKHWLRILTQGLVVMVGVYLILVSIYMVCNQLVWPMAHVDIEFLASIHRIVLVYNLVLIGAMLCVDGVLLVQMAVIDEARVKSDLTWAEGWLSGRINRILDWLAGHKNPIRRYADRQVREYIVWLNKMFRGSLASIIGQIVLRVVVAASLFTCYVFQP